MELTKEKSTCFLMIFLIIGYFSQEVLYSQDSVISQLFLGLLFVLSIFYLFKLFFVNEFEIDEFVYIWMIFLILNIITFIFKGEFTDDYINRLKGILLNMLPFFAFYYFTKKGILKSNHLLLVFWVLLIISIIKFNNSINELKQLKGNPLNMVSNTSYLFLGLIPFVFLFKRRIFSYLTLFLMFVFLLQSLKRASIIGGIIGFVILFYEQFKNGKGRFKGLHYIGSTLIILTISYFGYQYMMDHQNVIVRFQSMLAGDSSGRETLVNIAFDYWHQSDSYITYLFGEGFASTLKIIGGSAHNDFIEVLVSFGLIGSVFYMSIFYFGFKEVFNSNRNLNNRSTLICLLLIGLITSVTSRWYTSNFAYSQMLLLPYIIANYKFDEK